MSKFKEHDVVYIKKDTETVLLTTPPQYETIPAGSQGVIVHKWDENTFEVEITMYDGHPTVLTFEAKDLKLKL